MDPVTSPPSETPEIKLHFLDYWRIIRVRKAIILTIFTLVVITTTLVTFWLKPVYSSRVRISVEKDITDVSGIADNRQNYYGVDPFWLQTEFEKIQSQMVLSEVIKRLGLCERWSRLSPTGVLKPDEAFKELKKQMKVAPSRNTSLIEIWVSSPDKEEAARIANEIAEVYKMQRLKLRSEMRVRGIDTLKEELGKRDQEVRKAQQLVDDIRLSNNIPDIGVGNASAIESATLNTETLKRLEQLRIEAQADFVQYNTLLTGIKALSPEQLKNSITTAFPDNQLGERLSALALAEQKLVSLQPDYSREHPEVKRAQAVVDKLETQVNEMIAGIILGLETRVEHYKARLDEIQAEVKRAQDKDIQMTSKYRPYFDAKRELEQLLRVKEALALRIQQEEVDLQLPTSSIVTVTDKAEPSLYPVWPNKLLNVGLSLVVGLILGVGFAFFIEYLDTSVKTIDDVERALQTHVIGVVPQNVGNMLDEGVDTPYAEAYRVIRTQLLFARKDDSWNTFTVVSAGAGEGKSTTLFNLATIFAQNGSRVLLVDSDLRRPSLHRVLKVSNAVGLTDILLNQKAVAEVVQPTKLATLEFIPSGKLPSSAMGILNSDKMRALIQDLKKRYDFVFFDSPPLMGVSDASILASEVDMVVQVIQYRRYPQSMTLRAKQLIQKVHGNLLGVVLNNINVGKAGSYYSGYYDYYSSKDSKD